MDISKLKVPDSIKLVGASNYPVWSYHMKRTFKRQQLWYLDNPSDPSTSIPVTTSAASAAGGPPPAPPPPPPPGGNPGGGTATAGGGGENANAQPGLQQQGGQQAGQPNTPQQHRQAQPQVAIPPGPRTSHPNDTLCEEDKIELIHG
jgi:hypothetical protein